MKIPFIRSFLLILLFAMTTGWAGGQTILQGVIAVDSTLSLARSPYLVVGNLLVNQYVTLSVEPGAVIKFNPGIQLLLRGKLVANGTAADSILFSSDLHSQTAWAGIKIDDYPGAKAECSYFRGRFANTFFDHQRASGYDTVIKVTHCLLDSNLSVMSMHNVSSSPTKQYFDSSVFSHNYWVTNYGCNSTFTNCVFSNGYSGVRNEDFSSMTTTIDHCVFYNFSHAAAGAKTNITYSSFYDNAAAITWWYYTEVHYNDIFDNAIGIDVWWDTPNGSSYITENRICNNVHNVELHYSSDFNVINNCWCLKDSAEIRATMWDFFKAAGLGIVNYTPYDTTCTIPTGVPADPDRGETLRIYPNPASHFLNVKLPGGVTHAEARIFSAFGKPESSQEISGQQEPCIDVSALSGGIHILEIRTSHAVYREKFIKID